MWLKDDQRCSKNNWEFDKGISIIQCFLLWASKVTIFADIFYRFWIVGIWKKEVLCIQQIKRIIVSIMKVYTFILVHIVRLKENSWIN